jgi:hypothetical protein
MEWSSFQVAKVPGTCFEKVLQQARSMISVDFALLAGYRFYIRDSSFDQRDSF